jgi:hypothetical protein
MSICKRFSWVVGLVVFTSQAWGQVASSPFSQYALGETYSNSLANTQGSAGLGVSLPQSWYINNQNPALLVYNTFASFQGGLLAEHKTISSSSASEKFKGGNMNYLVVAFPVKHNKLRNVWGTSLGLMPYSSSKYSFTNTRTIEGRSGTTVENNSGTGGLTQLYWSNGVRITPDFSIGLKSSYIFGSIDHTTEFITTQAPSIEKKAFMKGFKFDVGLSYSKDSIGSKNYRISVGTVYGISTNLRTFLSNISSSSGAAIDSTNGHTHLPSHITSGISLSRDGKWAIGAEYTYQDWSSFSTVALQQNPTSLESNLSKSWRFSFGGEFTPNAEAVEGIFKRMTYRLGVTAEQYPYTPQGSKVNDLGANFGFSIPTGRSSIDLGFKVGKRGNKTETIIQENYFKIYLGVTFNDIWFIKRKFD